MNKIDRGAHTDTFHPLGVLQIGTWPLSATAQGSVPSYTTEFSAPAYRHVVRRGTAVRAGIGLLQTSLMFVVAAAGQRRRHVTPVG